MTAAALELQAVEKRFSSVVAVHAVTLHARAGGSYGLIGPNGAGKSTLFDLISGVRRPDSGHVLLDGEDVTRAPAEELARRGVLRSYQHTNVFGSLSVRDNLIVGGYLIDERRPIGSILMTRRYRRAASAINRRADEVLALVGMRERESMIARSLPYGELRYLEVAIALMSGPRLLLLDEPAAGLNAPEAARLQQILAQLVEQQEATTIVVEHNVGLVMSICDVVWVLDHGELIASGSPGDILRHPRVREVYLGV